MAIKMTCYKPSMLEEDASSLGSIHLSEGVSSTATHIRYHSAFWKWKDRPDMVKKLFVSCVIIVLVVGMIAVIGVSIGNPPIRQDYIEVPKNWKSPYCLTEKCIHTASYMLSSMNPKVNPCDNFYDFACGRWVFSNPIPDGRSLWGMFNQLEQNNQLVIKNVLERESFASTECEAEQKAKRYYVSCLDPNETTEALGAKPMIDVIRDIGGWKAIDTTLDLTTWRFERTLQKLHNDYSLGGLFFWYVAENDKNSSEYIIQLDQPSLGLPSIESYKNITENTKLYSVYLDYMTTVSGLLGADPNTTREEMKNVITFEARLASIMEPDEARRDEDKNYHSMSIRELQSHANFMNWKKFFASAFDQINRTIETDQKVVVYATTYFSKLSDLMTEYKLKSNTNKYLTLHHYMVWQAVRQMVGYLSKPFRESQKGLRKVLFGSEGSVENWRYCIADTNNVLGFALGALYVREAFHGNSKLIAKKMINNIRDAFKENFEKLVWMDRQTLQLAKSKADSIADMIGFPNYILNAEELNEKYVGLEIEEDEYFLNNIRVNRFRLKENMLKLAEPVNKSKWHMTPSTVNAYYSPNTNRIVFPAGILQAPFYEQDQNLALNYGGIGVVMGHELTHAFDDQGREYDEHGNLNQWWKNETINRFKQATECVIEQYSEFKVNGKALNGIRTLGENIADNGGLKAAYHAYLKLSEKNKEQFPLPGLNFTQDQLFFISFAQVWCSASTNEALSLQIDKDAHSPSLFRVNGPLQNLKEFSDVWNCSATSKMNPPVKCEIW